MKDLSVLTIILTTPVECPMGYINSLLFGVPEYHLHKLQRVQNAAARPIFQESRFCHITPLLMSLHWLPVKYRIVFKITFITFKAYMVLPRPT